LRRARRAGEFLFLPAVVLLSTLLVLAVERVAGGAAALGLALMAVAAAALLHMPAHWWPSVMLLATAAAPANAIPVPGIQGQNGSTSPALFVLVAWVVHELVLKRFRWTAQRRWTALAAVPLIIALGLSTATTGLGVGSVAWSANAVLFLVLVPLLMEPRAAQTLVTVLVATGAVLGVYATLEAQVIHGNPLWSWAGGWDGRARAGFGHPLYAASFFSTALVAAIYELAKRPTPRGALLAAACGAGLASAGSRGALIAALVGIIGLAVAILLGRAGSRRQLAPMAVIGILFLIVGAAGLAQRSAAGDSEGSVTVRARSLDTGLYIASHTSPLGGGPGRAYVIKTTTPGPGTDEKRSIENAWVELYVAVGPVGCAALALFLVAVIGIGIAWQRWLGVAASLSLLVGYTFYNALEGGRPLSLVLLGFSLALCLAPHDRWRASAAAQVPTSAVGPRATAPGESTPLVLTTRR